MLDYSQPENWHEISNLFPLIEGRDAESLADSIMRVGLLNPIAIYEGKVLDGRNRAIACKIAGVAPSIYQWKGESALLWALSQNAHRRTLTQSQKAVVALNAIERLQKDKSLFGDKRIEIADIVGVGRHYVSDVQRIASVSPQWLPQIASGALSVACAIRRLGDEDEHHREPTTNQVLSMFLKSIPYSICRAAYLKALKKSDEDRSKNLRYLWTRIKQEIYGQANIQS